MNISPYDPYSLYEVRNLKGDKQVIRLEKIFSTQCSPKRFSIKTKKGSKAKVERTTLAKSTTSFTSYGKYKTFRTSQLVDSQKNA